MKRTPKNLTCTERVENLAQDLAAFARAYEKKAGEEFAEKGEKALEIISGHPLYASTSGMTYAEAIAIASLLVGDIDDYIKENEDYDEYIKECQERGELNKANPADPDFVKNFTAWRKAKIRVERGEKKDLTPGKSEKDLTNT